MEFPLLNIGQTEWSFDIFSDMVFYDEFYYSKDLQFYEKYFWQKDFVDSFGNVFRVIGIEPIKRSLWKKFTSRKQFKIIFIPLQKRMTFIEVKSFIIDRIMQLDSREGQKKWLEILEKAKTIKGLIHGSE